MMLQPLICAYAVLNAILYSTLLPLWEGFDEPFHYLYVQDLADGRGFPDLTTSRLSLEIGTSLTLAPASRPVQQNLPMGRTYSEYFSQSRSQQLSKRKLLDEIDPHSRWSPSYILNYEGQQAPLAYIFLAAFDRALSSSPLRKRILFLRIVCATIGAVLLYLAIQDLLAHLPLTEA